MTHDLDTLIDRILDETASEQEWARFRTLAATSPEAWRRLAEQQRMLSLLRRGVSEATASAVQVNLPMGAGLSMWNRVLRHSGWAAAIAVGLLWAGMTATQNSVNQNDPRQAIVTPESDAQVQVAEMPQRSPRLDSAWISKQLEGLPQTRELPPLILQKQVTSEGVEVTVVRRILERRTMGQVHDAPWASSEFSAPPREFEGDTPKPLMVRH